MLCSLSLQSEKSEVCRGKDEVVTVKEQEIATKQRALLEQVGYLAEECANKKGKPEELTTMDRETKQVILITMHKQILISFQKLVVKDCKSTATTISRYN